MLFKKDKFIIQVNHGEGRKSVGPLRGQIDNILIHPETKKWIDDYIVYDFKILDSDNDEIFFKKNIIGKLRVSDFVPVGMSHDEVVTCVIENSSYNTDFKVVFLTREK